MTRPATGPDGTGPEPGPVPAAGTVLQAGVPRSGNSWLYRILVELHRKAGVPWRSYIASHPIQEKAREWDLSLAGQAQIDMIDIGPAGCHLGVSSLFRERIPDFDSFVHDCLIVWTHSPFDPRSAPLFGRFARIFYIARDPRDVLVSMAHFRHTPYSRRMHPHGATASAADYAEINADDLAWYWTKHVASYLAARQPGADVICYERLTADPAGSAAWLSQRLGLGLSPAAAAQTLAGTGFGKLRAGSPQHLRAGTAGQWRHELTASQVSRVEAIAAPMMDLLGYPRADAAVPARLPGLTAAPAAGVRAALAAAQRAARPRARPGWEI